MESGGLYNSEIVMFRFLFRRLFRKIGKFVVLFIVLAKNSGKFNESEPKLARFICIFSYFLGSCESIPIFYQRHNPSPHLASLCLIACGWLASGDSKSNDRHLVGCEGWRVVASRSLSSQASRALEAVSLGSCGSPNVCGNVRFCLPILEAITKSRSM